MAILSNGKFYGFLCSVKETGQKLVNGVKEYVEDFVSGFAGHGWKLWEYMTGKWKLEIDTIVVRETMLVFEMLISKVRAIIGAQAITQGHGKVKFAHISDDGTEYLIELEDKDLSIVAHDFVRCQTFVGDKTKLYHVKVSSVDVETRTLHIPISEFERDESGIILNSPTAGDELVQFGNSQNKARQSAIYLHADESGQPAIDVMFDVDSKNWDGKVKIRLGGDIPGTNGLKGFYCENGMIKGVDSNSHTTYCIYPDGSAEFGDGSAAFRKDKSGFIAGGAIWWIWDEAKGKCVCTMKDVVLTWDNLSDEVKENLKGEPGKDGKDANLLPWIEKWNGYATELGEEYIVTPKMFSGTKTTNSEGKVLLTGIAQGKDCLTAADGTKRTGIFALVDNEIVFELDPMNKQYKFSGKVETRKNGKRIVIDPENNSFEMYNIDDSLVFSLSFETDASSSYPVFLIQGTEFNEYFPFIKLTGRAINAKVYLSERGNSADVIWGVSENGIFHKKNNQGFNLNVDLAQTSIPVGESGNASLHLTRFAPGYLPGYNAAKTGEVYVTSDGTLKIKDYSVDS